ncbi:Tll0287-like domain-containing protein [Marinoscillum sp.]|uniref:Tll0287-like domain-containing protein n=1 Tax=Marinoscillum sp. TaxID=2024838 RepID=UPI003BA9D661
MRPTKNTLFLVFGFLCIYSCTPKKPVDREGFRQEKAARELKRIAPADLMQKGEQLGEEILSATASAYLNTLKRAIVENGISGAIGFCQLSASGIASDLQDSLGVTISRVTDKPRNPVNTLSASDKAIWEAYEYVPENLDGQIQEYDTENLIYTKPITIGSTLCLNCHGRAGSDITPENYSLIKSQYPDDQAINYEVGDFRGMWRILLPKKAVVSKL